MGGTFVFLFFYPFPELCWIKKEFIYLKEYKEETNLLKSSRRTNQKGLFYHQSPIPTPIDYVRKYSDMMKTITKHGATKTNLCQDFVTFLIAFSCSFSKYRLCSPLIFSSIAFAIDC